MSNEFASDNNSAAWRPNSQSSSLVSGDPSGQQQQAQQLQHLRSLSRSLENQATGSRPRFESGQNDNYKSSDAKSTTTTAAATTTTATRKSQAVVSFSSLADCSASGGGKGGKASSVASTTTTTATTPASVATATTVTSSQQYPQTSGTQRLGSIEILNENRQRQLQLKQQESFKQHLEQRQKLIKQEFERQQEAGDQYSQLVAVNTEAPEFARRMVAQSAAESMNQTRAGQQQQQQMNPFDEQPSNSASIRSKLPVGAAGGGPTTVSGKSGFLSALMAEEAAEADANREAAGAAGHRKHVKQVVEELDCCDDEHNAENGSDLGEAEQRQNESRYNKVASAGASSYNYDADPSRQPFYKRDWTTLLQDCRSSRQLIILIVAIALLLDNMLLTSVVPIIPAYLYRLRIERQHRELLVANRSTTMTTGNGGANVNKLPNNLDTNLDGQIDGDELEAELARRINQSLAAVQDRFSGSVFQPRVVKGPSRSRSRDRPNTSGADDDNDNSDDDDDDDDDDNAGDSDDRTNGAGDRSSRIGSRLPLMAVSKSRGKRAAAPSKPIKQSNGNLAGRDPADEYEDVNDDDDDDNDNDNDDKEAGANAAGGSRQIEQDRKPVSMGQRRRQQALKRLSVDKQLKDNTNTNNNNNNYNAKVAMARETDNPSPRDANEDIGRGGGNGNNADGNQDGDDDDDDDEDSLNARKWSNLKSSLVSMTKVAGNDSEALGGMCLSMVLDRPSYYQLKKAPEKGRDRSRSNSDDNDDDDDDNDNDGNGKPMSNQAKAFGDGSASKGANARSRAANGARSSKKVVGGRQINRNNNEPNLARRPEVKLITPGQRAQSAQSRPSAEQQARDSSKDDNGDKEDKNKDKVKDNTADDIDDDTLIISHQDIVDESFEVGVMFASKPIVQAIANPFVGAITNRVGFTLPMFLGFTIMFLSTLVFAFGETYATLFLARAIQGVGSACTSVAGMSMIADRFPDDAERGNAMAIALGGLALGVVIGPPFGGFMFEFFGKPSPFIVLAILALADGLLQLLVLQPRITKSQDEGASLMTLIKDPYILVAAGAITFANTGIGILEPALPLWMMDTMQAKNWEQGVAFLPAALSYLFSTNLFGNLGLRIGRWRSAMLGLIIIGLSLLIIPFATRVDHLILPNGAIGFAIGMVDSTMMPMLGYLVDIRHTSVYGSVYAIGDVAFCASFVFGPALSGTLVELIGFEGLIITTALICFAFAPLLILLRNPPARQVDDAQLHEQSSLRYVNYNQLDSPDEEAQLTASLGSKTTSYVK